jgi:hypothetical protein
MRPGSPYGASRAGSGEAGEAQAIREAMTALRRLGLEIWSAVADALESNLDYLEGQRERAIQGLEEAEQTFRRLHMLCLAACARRRRGQFNPTELGRRLELEADRELVALGVAVPERWTRAYWSVFDVQVDLPTQNHRRGTETERSPEPSSRPGPR